MKSIKLLSLVICAIISFNAYADCELALSVVQTDQPEDVPTDTQEFLITCLQNLALNDGIIADEGKDRFFLTAKFNHILEDVVPGPPTQYGLHSYLTLYIGDNDSQTIYSSTTVEVRGVGTSQQRAFINALKSISGSNPKIKEFVHKGKQRIINYYDDNYVQIIEKAEMAFASHDYSQAIWHLSSIPECSKGYNAAKPYLLKAYKAYIDQAGIQLLNKAKSKWAASHDAEGGAEAMQFLQEIDPESSSYNAAMSLFEEISKSVASDRTFEMRKKYNDAIDLERRKIRAAKKVGVAYGRGQKPKTTYIMWLK